MAVLALDVGTSSARAALYDAAGTAVSGRFQRVAYEPRLTRDGGVEHDAARLLEAVAACLDAVLAGPGHPGIQAVGIDTFWHWGKPLPPGPPAIIDVIEPDRARHARYREALAAQARLDAALAARREPPAV
jgi:hypothetical protein